MSSIHYDKLVRDKIPEIIRAAGKEPVTDVIPAEKMAAALDRKLQEEVSEFLESHNLEEIADVLEVLHGIARNMGEEWESVERARLEKREARGGFEEGICLLEVKSM